ncbi:MAG TPA: 6,7-dimethyl-8-ribityllumazine synthase [Caulobacteraceae bacterium]|jgi:6,7-dimethyl-8-ribityllumazine synthase|nr:6,7-dimethyl-8-ribityllumazine synthase [Caulobacteraceae bacterium]
MLEDPLRILIVEARDQEPIAEALLAGAQAALKAAGTEVDVVSVPGPLELPGAIAMAEEGGHRPAGVRYDGYVALGCVMRGETGHHQIVATESTRGLIDLAVGRRLAIGNGILTVDTAAQAARRAAPDELDRGGRAARDCLAVIGVRKRLLGTTR